jgi:hypothetical protein
MRKTSKRYLAILLAFLMMLSFAPMVMGASYEVASEEADPIEEFVNDLYWVVLGRAPDEAGFNEWVRALKAGQATGVSIAHAFFFGPEYAEREKNNEYMWDGDFVQFLYIAVLGRGWEGFDWENEWWPWTELLTNGLPRENVFAGFVNSAEFAARCTALGIDRGSYTPPAGGNEKMFLRDFYDRALGRTTQSCIDAWADIMVAGKSMANVAHAVIFSAEFGHENFNNREFIEALYRILLGRDPEPDALAHWISELNKGTTREQVFASFVNGAEFAARCAAAGVTAGTFTPPAASRTTILDQNGVRVTHVSTETGKWNNDSEDEDSVIHYTNFIFLIENNTGNTINIWSSLVRVNGVHADNNIATTLLPGATARAVMGFNRELAAMNTVDFIFMVEDWFTGEIAFISPRVALTSAPTSHGFDNVTPTFASNGDTDKVLMDKDDIKITYVGIEERSQHWVSNPDTGWGEWVPGPNPDPDGYTSRWTELVFNIENNSDKAVFVNSALSSINGNMAWLNFPWEDSWHGALLVLPGENVEVGATVNSNATSQYGISVINEIQLVFRVYVAMWQRWGSDPGMTLHWPGERLFYSDVLTFKP